MRRDKVETAWRWIDPFWSALNRAAESPKPYLPEPGAPRLQSLENRMVELGTKNFRECRAELSCAPAVSVNIQPRVSARASRRIRI
jgi:hypothetical protein